MYIQIVEGLKCNCGIRTKWKYNILDDQGNVIKTTTGRTVLNHLKKDLDMKQPLRYENVRYFDENDAFVYFYYDYDDIERSIKLKSGELVCDNISVWVSLDGKKAEITNGTGGLELAAEVYEDGDNTWIGVSSRKYGYFIPVLVQKLEESAIPPWDYDNPHEQQRMSYADLGGICQVKATLFSTTHEDYWVKNGGVGLRFSFERTPEMTTCSVSIMGSKGEYWMGLARKRDFELQFTDSKMRFGRRTYRRFTPADLSKAQQLGSYEKVFS